MNEITLANTVERFALLTCGLPDPDLERPWAWKDYREGVRHAFFRTYEELRQMAVDLGTRRAAAGQAPTTAQRILAQYHSAYRDLQAVLLGISDEDALREPVEREWPLQRVLAHIVAAERGFFAILLHALDNIRAGNLQPVEMTEEQWNEFWAGDNFETVAESGSLTKLLAYYDRLHKRILQTFSSITDEELQAPSIYWESEPMPVQFRLHRFDAHLRQHTVQAEKALVQLDLSPSEARRLLRLVYAALAETEGATIGSIPFGDEGLRDSLAVEITHRSQEIAQAIAGE